ncbi:SGNH/GDSL hydrolase family protein [Rhodoferax sp.]|uniref:SGNH/GDSL hydrolase family protein n=1 Tax=Rhodoferax sp. TaxID=50421 RepID=UPI00284998E5|nr:SGNH/GDSL hydrolase family protein [Rhodoferax sp.]MDR3368139.1 SGNH/GDSL hydrolase family protein [Rhodoferax sp.]
MNGLLTRFLLQMRTWAVTILGTAAVLLPALASPTTSWAEGGQRLVTAWSSALQAIPQGAQLPALYSAPKVAGRTIRQIIYPTLDASIARLHVSNAFSREPLVIREISIGPSAAGAALQANGAVRVSFAGRSSLTLAPGAEIDSDPVNIAISKGSPYAISLYVGAQQRLVAWHRIASQVNYISTPGNHVADVSGTAYEKRITQYAWLTALSVVAPSANVIAALGDSITDGMRSSVNRNQRWPDALARRFATTNTQQTAVINLGISGNRLLSDSPCYGEALVKRLDRDLIHQTGVTSVILLIGINDINFAAMPARQGLDCDFPHTAPTPNDLINGYRRVIAAVHQAGMRLFLATLTPASLPTPREAMRQTVNQWIRLGELSDGVIDFDAALRDPASPSRLRLAYDSGDHIHPSDAGYAAMANAVPLATVRRTP